MLAIILLMAATGLAALRVTLQPAAAWSNATNVTLHYALDGPAEGCTLYTNESGWSPKENGTSANSSDNNLTHAFADGIWAWNVACTEGNNTTWADANGTLGMDTALPVAPPVQIDGYNVSWTAASDARSGIGRYELYRNGTLLLNTTNASVTSLMDVNATANATYAYALDVMDQAGNRNRTTASFEPLLELVNLSIVKTGPRTFNASWTTAVAANRTITFSTQNGNLTTLANASYDTAHKVELLTPAFGPFNGTIQSCRRACVNQTFQLDAPATINITAVFYNASYNNRSALLAMEWTSQYGLTYVSATSNNSGKAKVELASTLPESLRHAENLSFWVNETALEVWWNITGTDRNGDFVSANQSFRLYPNATQPVLPVALNESFIALGVGQEVNASNGYRLRLLGLSSIPSGASNFLSAAFQTLTPAGEPEERFFLEENGVHNTANLAIRLFRIFLGSGNTSYAQVDAQAVPTATPTPQVTVEPTPTEEPETPTPSPTPTPTPAPTPQPTPEYAGRLLHAEASTSRPIGSPLSGYVVSADDSVAMQFNATYEHSGEPAELYLSIRVLDDATNRTLLTARSKTRKIARGQATFTTDAVRLLPGQYRADAAVAAEGRNSVLDERSFRFTVPTQGAGYAVPLTGLLGLLALGVFVFTLKINHHKKDLMP